MSDDPIREGIQEALDACAGGYHVAHYVVIAGGERIIDSEMEAATWMFTGATQASYITDGLLLRAHDLQCDVSEETD